MRSVITPDNLDRSNGYKAYEKQKTEEQVDDIADWLDRSSTNATSRFQRLPVGIIQRQFLLQFLRRSTA